MPYLFKLSRRVARLRTHSLLLATAAILGACESTDPALSGPSLTHPSFATATGLPAGVTDLAAAAMTDTSATLTFTEVDDGTGAPASYDIRLAPTPLVWGGAVPSVKRGTCASPLTGTAIGSKRSCTVAGLAASTTYSFELVAYRGTLKVNAVFGALSNIATGPTTVVAPAAVAAVSVSPATGIVVAGSTQRRRAAGKEGSGNGVTGRSVTWTSSNAAVATVNGSGLVTTVAPGAATITATSGTIAGTSAITVTAPTLTAPGTVTDFKVAAATDTTVTLSFT